MQEWFQASGGLVCSSLCIGDEKAVQTGAKRNSCSGLAGLLQFKEGQAIRSRQLPPARRVGPPSISSETGLHDNTRQLTLKARLWEGLERGGRHGLKPMLRPPSTSSVTPNNTRQLTLIGTWLSLLRPRVPVSWPRSESDECGDFVSGYGENFPQRR